MREIELTRGLFAIVDDIDYPLVAPFNWYAHSAHHTWYAVSRTSRKEDHKVFRMHRFLLGITDPLIKVDHRDHDGLNNRRENLRSCTNAENIRNSRLFIRSTSGFKGVSWNAQCRKWSAFIYPEGNSIYLGNFDNPEDAARAYDDAAIRHYGEFARLNFPV
jgi:hypothetical protein